MNLRRKATMAALSAAAISGIALAAPAQAAGTYLGMAASLTQSNSAGLTACKEFYPTTTSVQYQGIGGSGGTKWYVYRCYS